MKGSEMKVTDWLAVYGAVLASLTFLWNVLKARPRIKVVMVYGIEGDKHGGYISIQNNSEHAVRISAISLASQRRMSLWACAVHAVKYRRLNRWIRWNGTSLRTLGVEDGCPVTIPPHDEYHVIVPLDVVDTICSRSACKSTVAIVQDVLWNNAYSNRYESLPKS